MALVHLERVEGDVLAQIRQGIERILGVERLKRSGTVVLKPNVVSDVPEYIANGCNTDLEVIEGVVGCFTEYGWNVIIGESETGTALKGRHLDRAWEHMGVYRLQEQYGCKLVNFTYEDKVSMAVPGGRILPKLGIARVLAEADVVVDLPKLKTHKYTTITGALKNMFGCIPDPMRIVHHHHLSRIIAELNFAFRDRLLVVLDGITGMEGNGPLYGTPVNMGLLGFSDNALATDLVACGIMQIPTENVKHLEYYRTNFDHLRVDDVEVTGVPVAEVRQSFLPVEKKWLVSIEWAISKHPLLVRLLFSDVVRRNVTIRLNPILRRLRGGSYSWYP